MTYLLFVPKLRASILERFRPIAADILALRFHDPPMLSRVNTSSDRLRVLSRLGVFAHVLARTPNVLETVEPLWLREWPFGLLMAIACKGAAAARRKPLFVFTYAIENLDASEGLTVRRTHFGRTGPGSWLARLADPLLQWLWGLSIRSLDGVVFGTYAAEANYISSWPAATSRLPHIVIEERLALCATCFDPDQAAWPASREVLFAAEFSERKGINTLMVAWEILAEQVSGWRLLLFGVGPNSDEVMQWSRLRSDATAVSRATRVEIHQVLRRCAIVALPSTRVQGWREQVGLSILEGEAHGCTVVASSETGLAESLKQRGHVIIRPGDPLDLARGLIAAVRRHTGSKDLSVIARSDSRKDVYEWVDSERSGSHTA